MIIRVWSDLPTFREAAFSAGMNVVLADRADDSEDTESTNGLGKTTLLRIIHFCLGSDLSKDKVLKHPKLKGVIFGIDFGYDGKTISASRNTASPEKVAVSKNFVSGVDVDGAPLDEARVSLTLESWKSVLTKRFAPSPNAQVLTPSFRDIAHYLIRLGKPAFSDPLTAFQGQPGPSKRLTVSYLLGLNWSGQSKLQSLLETRSQVDAAIRALNSAVEATSGEKSIGDLEAERVALEAMIEAKKVEVESFNLREDYKDLQTGLQRVDSELHRSINDNFSDKRLLEHYQKSAEELPEADPDRPISILRDAGAVFREEALKTLDEVAHFHAEVHRNRSAFLQSEIKRLKKTIKDRQTGIDELTAEKSRILGLLKSSGALEQLIELQKNYTELNARCEALKARIAERKKFDIRKEELTAEIARERALMRQDLDDRKTLIDQARLLFAEYSKFLYGNPGGLAIDINASGYGFTFTIERGGSDGVDQMVVFCFDLMIATLRARRKQGFCTLVHDSAMFADVDPRQYGLALQLAEQKSKLEGFQYICCLNSGALPTRHSGNLSIDQCVRLRLSDESDSGRLLGLRLPPREQAA